MASATFAGTITYSDLYVLGKPPDHAAIGWLGMSDAEVTGAGTGPGLENTHALLWKPAATSGIDLKSGRVLQLESRWN